MAFPIRETFLKLKNSDKNCQGAFPLRIKRHGCFQGHQVPRTPPPDDTATPGNKNNY
ncbi:hypothetical protein HMPREF3038_00948 [Akkermansia sp. KLE1797]|nr:hypothetical protein HMPREF3038_00948 [Akkermansia sp. KLE1797]